MAPSMTHLPFWQAGVFNGDVTQINVHSPFTSLMTALPLVIVVEMNNWLRFTTLLEAQQLWELQFGPFHLLSIILISFISSEIGKLGCIDELFSVPLTSQTSPEILMFSLLSRY